MIGSFKAFKQDQNVNDTLHYTNQSLSILAKSVKDIASPQQFDQDIQDFANSYQKAWDARVNFWQYLNQNGLPSRAQDFNHLANYGVIYGFSKLKHQSIDQAIDHYVDANVLAYSIPMKAIDTYNNIKQQSIEYITEVTGDNVLSSARLLAQSPKMQSIYNTLSSMKDSVEKTLAVEVPATVKLPFKSKRITLFTVKIPTKVKNWVKKAADISKANDSFDAVNFIMMTQEGDGRIADYQFMTQMAQKQNDFAKLAVKLSQGLSAVTGIPETQAYYALMDQLMLNLNHHFNA